MQAGNFKTTDKLFINCDIYTGEKALTQRAVLVRGDSIAAILGLSEIPKDVEIIDLKGKILAPGYIDVQVNGGGGVLFNDMPAADSLETISKAHERFGTLNFCPTITSSGIDTILRGLEAVNSSKKDNIGVMGIHLEGPFIEKSKAGIHDRRHIRPASDDEINEIISRANGAIRIITVAPEAVTPGQIELISNAGIKVFIGHTNATCCQVLEAFERGAVGVTHLFNAMSQICSREPGAVGASFIDDESWAGIIADGYHVDYRSVLIAKKNKGSKLFLVTDAMPPVGKPDAKYSIGRIEISNIGGRLQAPDGTLAGSSLDMASAVRNVVQKCGIAKDEAIRMASTYVARMLGADDKIGLIKPGMIADMITLDEQLHVEAIIRRGVYLPPR